MKKFCVYILQSKKTGRYYCGQTADFSDRLTRHNSGRSKSTKSGVPWKVVRIIDCDSRSVAVQLERKIKKRGIERFLTDTAASG